jgi:hypothetical protein
LAFYESPLIVTVVLSDSVSLHSIRRGNGFVSIFVDEFAVVSLGILGEDGRGKTRSEVGECEDYHKGEEPA